MPRSTDSVRIEIKTPEQAAILSYALGLVHRDLANRLEEIEDSKLDLFMDNVKWTRKNANALNEKFSLTTAEYPSRKGLIGGGRTAKRYRIT